MSVITNAKRFIEIYKGFIMGLIVFSGGIIIIAKILGYDIELRD